MDAARRTIARAVPTYLLPSLGLFTLPECIKGQRQMLEGQKDYVEIVVASEDAPAALESSEEPLDLVGASAYGLVVPPGYGPGGVGRHDGHKAQLRGESAGFVAFVGRVHAQGAVGGGRASQALKQRTATPCGASPA
jgi:hypothetical protein